MKESTIEKVDRVIETYSDSLMTMMKSNSPFLDDILEGIDALAKLVTARASIEKP